MAISGWANVKTASGTETAQVDVLSVDTTGADGYLLAACTFNNNGGRANPDVITSVTLDPGGPDETALTVVAGTRAITGGDDGLTELYELKAPPTANSPYTVRFIIATATLALDDMICGVWPLTGVDQTTPSGGGANNNGLTGNASVTVASETDDYVFGVMFIEAQTAGVVQSPASADWAISLTDGCAGAHEAGAASVVLDWTNVSDKWAASGVNINAATGTSRNPPQGDLVIDLKTPTLLVPSHIREKGFRFRNDGAIGAP